MQILGVPAIFVPVVLLVGCLLVMVVVWAVGE